MHTGKLTVATFADNSVTKNLKTNLGPIRNTVTPFLRLYAGTIRNRTQG